MKVRASEYEQYIFQLEPADAPFLGAGFKRRITTTEGGFTLDCYDEVPDTIIQGNQYFFNSKSTSPLSVPATATCYQPNKNKMLYDLGLVAMVDSNYIGLQGLILKPNPLNIIQADGFLFSANHIPQLFSPFMGALIIAIDGSYSWKKGQFYGFLRVGIPYDNKNTQRFNN